MNLYRQTIGVAALVILSGCSLRTSTATRRPPPPSLPTVAVAGAPTTSATIAAAAAITSTATTSTALAATTSSVLTNDSDEVMAAYARYVAARRSGSSGDASTAAAYRLAGRPAVPEDVTVRGVRTGASSAAVEECVDGRERLVVLAKTADGWVVVHVLGRDAAGEWCE